MNGTDQNRSRSHATTPAVKLHTLRTRRFINVDVGQSVVFKEAGGELVRIRVKQIKKGGRAVLCVTVRPQIHILPDRFTPPNPAA